MSDLAYGAISVGGTAAIIVPANPSASEVEIVNIHATQTLYVGFDSSVTTGNGFPLVPNNIEGSRIKIRGNEPIYGIGSGAATTGRYIQTGT